MPEGDTIFCTASRLRPVLLDQTITAAVTREPALSADDLTERVVHTVEARGKHLLIHLDNGCVLHSHLGMHGSWYIHSPEQTWEKPRERAALVLEVPEYFCGCFYPKTLELLSPDAFRRHPHISHLGPDLLSDNWDPAEALQRFRIHDGRPIGDAVMDQTIVCGIGNIYKSEVLFVCRINPFAAVRSLDDATLLAMLDKARELMSKNLQGAPRRTRFALDKQRMWIYGRSGRNCFRCRTRIQLRRQGDLGRTTYWCPGCQS